MRILSIYNINKVAETYGEDMTQRGHYVKVYEPSLAGAAASSLIKLAMMPGRVVDLRKVIGDLNPNNFDLVHIHWASYGVLGLLGRIPFIVHCHGEDVLHPSFRPILTPVFQRAEAVMCITPDLMAPVQAMRSDAIFFPGSIDADRFNLIESKQANPRGRWTVLLFSRLVPKKGIEIAIQGIMQFLDRHPEAHVKLVEWGSEKEKYKQMYGERLEFVHRVEPGVVQHLIQSADVVVGQLLAGALGLSELEAMSCAKPVITSFRYEEAYPTPPPLCQATTAQEVDAHLEYLFQHPQAGIALGQKAREWIKSYHSRQVLANKLEKLYHLAIRKERKKISSMYASLYSPEASL